MTRKQLDTMREIRLWACRIIGPACIAGSILLGNPEATDKIKGGAKAVKRFFKNKFKRKES